MDAVCVPFTKFGNYGESYANEVNWNTAFAEEKLDGSLIKIWNYNNEWIISTNGTIFARNAPLDSNKFNNFEELFLEAVKITGLNIPMLNENYTYMFELCSPYNRVVVPHEEITLYHIGTRSKITYKEINVLTGVQKPRHFYFKDIKDVIEMAAKLKYNEEGFVVRDYNFNRVKIKSPAYVAVHHLINGMGEKRLLELIRNNEQDEFLAYFPEYKKEIDSLLRKITLFSEYINYTTVEQIGNVTFKTRKDFALVVTKTMFPAFFFAYYDNKHRTPLGWLWSFNNDKVYEIINKFEEEQNE